MPDYESIFLSLYVLNKSAKKSRDTQSKAQKENNFGVMKRAKKRKDYIYKIKHAAMKKLIEENQLVFEGIHKQEANGSCFYLSYYSTKSGFHYHIPSSKKEIKDFNSSKLESMDIVPAEVKRKSTIGYNEALSILLEYIENIPDLKAW